MPIESLKLARWDIRREDQEDEMLESLKNSILEHGLFNPLTVVRMSNSQKLIIMAGKRRFNALKELECKQIPVNVVLEDATETDIRVIKVNENLQIDELEDVAKGFGILATYESKGYTDQEKTIQGVKSIDNYLRNNKGKTFDDLLELRELSSVNSKRGRGRPLVTDLRSDEKFVNICRGIALVPKYQYQLLQIVVQLDPAVLIEAQKKNCIMYWLIDLVFYQVQNSVPYLNHPSFSLDDHETNCLYS